MWRSGSGRSPALVVVGAFLAVHGIVGCGQEAPDAGSVGTVHRDERPLPPVGRAAGIAGASAFLAGADSGGGGAKDPAGDAPPPASTRVVWSTPAVSDAQSATSDERAVNAGNARGVGEAAIYVAIDAVAAAQAKASASEGTRSPLFEVLQGLRPLLGYVGMTALGAPGTRPPATFAAAVSDGFPCSNAGTVHAEGNLAASEDNWGSAGVAVLNVERLGMDFTECSSTFTGSSVWGSSRYQVNDLATFAAAGNGHRIVTISLNEDLNGELTIRDGSDAYDISLSYTVLGNFSILTDPTGAEVPGSAHGIVTKTLRVNAVYCTASVDVSRNAGTYSCSRQA